MANFCDPETGPIGDPKCLQQRPKLINFIVLELSYCECVPYRCAFLCEGSNTTDFLLWDRGFLIGYVRTELRG